MAETGCSTARFNFRGGLNRGLASIADVKAVADWFTEPRDGKEPIASQVLLVGYNYGSIVAAAAVPDLPKCIGFAILGPPLSYMKPFFMLNGDEMLARAANTAGRPKLLTIGTDDIYSPLNQFHDFAK